MWGYIYLHAGTAALRGGRPGLRASRRLFQNAVFPGKDWSWSGEPLKMLYLDAIFSWEISDSWDWSWSGETLKMPYFLRKSLIYW